jgi:hypothetical protein
MPKMIKAILIDVKKEYVQAALEYEKMIIENDVVPKEVYINLGFLFWEFATEQVSFNVPNNIPDTWSVRGGESFQQVILDGIFAYPESLELHFWYKYLPYRLYQEEFTQTDCEALLVKFSGDESLVPYFFLSLFEDKNYTLQMDKLKLECNRCLTAKNLYILSFIS